jgi:hypothetical protein
MPTIDYIDGIKISVYNGEYRLPHIHAGYNEYEVLIIIENGEIYAGTLPNKQLRQVSNWLSGNSEWALDVFYQLNPHLR